MTYSLLDSILLCVWGVVMAILPHTKSAEKPWTWWYGLQGFENHQGFLTAKWGATALGVFFIGLGVYGCITQIH